MDVEIAQTLRAALPTSSSTHLARITAADTSESSGRCLRASTSIIRKQVVMRLPVSHAIQASALQRLLQHLGTDIQHLPPTSRNVPLTPMYKKILVLLFAASAGGEESSVLGLREYFATLPKSFIHMPLFWGARQIDRLGPLLSPTLHNFVQRMRNEMDRCLFDLQPLVDWLVESKYYPTNGTKEKFQLEFLGWAYCCLTSRTFDLTPMSEGPQEPKDDETASMEEHGLVPFMDLMNHASTPADATLMINVEPLQVVVEEKGEGVEEGVEGGTVSAAITAMFVTARATRELQEGEELCFSYRTAGEALKFLFNYGFVPEDAKDVFYLMVTYDDDESDHIDEHLSAALSSLGLPPTKTIAIPMTEEDPLPDLYVWALRVREMHLDKEARLECLQSFVSGAPLRLLQSHEERVWNGIATKIQESYNFYTEEEGEKEDVNGKGYEDQFVQRTRDAAVCVLEKAMAKFTQITGAD